VNGTPAETAQELVKSSSVLKASVFRALAPGYVFSVAFHSVAPENSISVNAVAPKLVAVVSVHLSFSQEVNKTEEKAIETTIKMF